MVRAEQNDRVVEHARALEDVQQLAELVVDIGDVGEIAAPGATHLLAGNVEGGVVRGVIEPLRMRVLLVMPDKSGLRVERLAMFVEIPELLARHVRVMRMRQRNGEAPGPMDGIVLFARKLIELLRGQEHDLVVIFHLVGGLGDAGAGHRTHIVIPPVDALAWLAVIRRPAEIGRIDVGGQPLLETVQLIRPDEMHLAGQAGVVAGGTQMMGEGRDGRREFGGIVIDPGTRRQLPAHERGAARRAERRGRIVVGKARRARGKRL